MTVGALTSFTADEGIASIAPPAEVVDAIPPVPMPTSPTIAPPPAVPAAAPSPASAPSPATWTVRPGDHFWNIAERLLSNGLQRPVTDAEIEPYWRLLVEANRDRLLDPENPDLLFEGQRLGVPPLPVPPETPAI